MLYCVVGLERRKRTDREANTARVVIGDCSKELGDQNPKVLKQPFKRGGGDVLPLAS